MKIDFRKRIGNLELCPNVYLNGKESDSLEICQWSQSDEYKWTIASFKYNEKEDYFFIEECGDRLDNEDFSWFDFGKLVRLGRKYLEVIKESE